MPSNGTIFLKGNKGYVYGYLINTSELRGGSRIPRRRGRQPSRGRQHMILPNFVKNCMKLRKFWAVGGGGRDTPALIRHWNCI